MMDARPLTDRYSVSPQISADTVPDIAAAGYTTVICNRPDGEVPPHLQAAAIRAAVEAAGLEFVELALTHETMTPDNAAHQRALVDAAPGPVLAYCASGTRCTVIWALGAAADGNVDDILGRAQAAGYQLEGLRPALAGLAARG